MAESEIESAITENATGPKKAAGDSGSMEQHPLPDQIAAVKFRKAQAAARSNLPPFRLGRCTPGGTV